MDAALALHRPQINGPLSILSRLGGREIAASLGAIIAARHQKTPVIIDGYVATAAAAIAHAINPAAINHCLFAHVAADKGHASALARMGQAGLLDLGIALGEGTGAALFIHLARAAARIYREMATFKSAGVDGPTNVSPP